MNILSTFNGYTIDFRLKEFRRIVYGEPLEFIPFDSEKGQQLLKEYLDTKIRDSQTTAN